MSINSAQLSVVRLTPLGRGAVASLLLYGSGAQDVFQKHFSKPLKPNRFRHRFGTFSIESLNQQEQLVVYCPHSNEVEFHCHGGEFIVTEIESVLVQDGAVPVSWQELFCGQDSQQDRALRQLPFAPTERTAQILLDQYNGAMERELALIHSLPDEAEKYRRQKRLLENARIGKHLVEPFRVVLAGASNAGKSSLLNSLAGFQRSIVHAAAGTTRDVVSVRIAVKGFPVELCDTAGFRGAADNGAVDELEREGMERSEKMLQESDGILWVIDATLPPTEQLLPPVQVADKTLLCYNKIDLPEASSRNSVTEISVSAVTGEGCDLLLERLFQFLVPRPPMPLEAVPLE